MKHAVQTVRVLPVPAAPAMLPVTLTVAVSATRRADLPDVFTAELEQSGRIVARRHFREGSEGPEDITDLVAEILLNRARTAKETGKLAQAERLANAMVETGKARRTARGSVVDEAMPIAGQTRSRALTALGTIRQRDLLTTRQFEAGDRMARDAKVLAGAREAKDDVPPCQDSVGGLAWEDYAIEAGRRLALARTVCQSMAAFDGLSPWKLVEQVVLNDRALTEAIASKSASVVRRAKIALRIGLDAVGDAYDLPAAVTRTSVLIGGIPVPMMATEDIDGRDRNDDLLRVWRSIKIDGKPVVLCGDSLGDLYVEAKKHMKSKR